MFGVKAKTALIITAVVLGVLALGTTPSKKVETPSWESPQAGEWCLGYNYKEGRYRYDTSSKQPAKKVIRKDQHSFELHENGNFTKEQAKDIQRYLESQSQYSEPDPDDILDNIEYYID